MKIRIIAAFVITASLAGCSGKPSECKEWESLLTEQVQKSIDNAKNDGAKVWANQMMDQTREMFKDLYADKASSDEIKAATCSMMVKNLKANIAASTR
jgi:predicted ATP-dependent serine protease